MTDPRLTIIAIAKNEGMFLLEWLAHNYAIGVDHVVIGTNDCEDGSDALLDAVARHFPLTHLDNSAPAPGFTIHQRGMARVMEQPEARNSDWLMHIDPDEFVNIRSADGQFKPFLRSHEANDAIAICWKNFGNNGRRTWDGGLVTDAFWSCEDALSNATAHKTVFRADVFEHTTPHMPKGPSKPSDELRLVNAEGKILPNDRLYNARNTGYRFVPETLTWEGAYVAHFMVKSWDLSRMKVHRGSCNKGSDERRRPGTGKYKKYNVNRAADFTLQATREARLEWLHKMMAVPEIADLHYGCLEWFFAMQRQMMRADAEPVAMIG